MGRTGRNLPVRFGFGFLSISTVDLLCGYNARIDTRIDAEELTRYGYVT